MDWFDHWLHDWLSLAGWNIESLFKLLLAAAAGGAVGLERELRGREAGFRTNLLVALGSALVMIVSNRLASLAWYPESAYNINVDPGRIAYGVMTGIGFLGAGAILKQDGVVRGLTTAAGLWCVAAIGLAGGLGLYTLTMLATLLVLFALSLLNYFEHKLPRRKFRKLTLRVPWQAYISGNLTHELRCGNLEFSHENFHRTADLSEVDVELNVSYLNHEDFKVLEQNLHKHPEYKLIASQNA